MSLIDWTTLETIEAWLGTKIGESNLTYAMLIAIIVVMLVLTRRFFT